MKDPDERGQMKRSMGRGAEGPECRSFCAAELGYATLPGCGCIHRPRSSPNPLAQASVEVPVRSHDGLNPCPWVMNFFPVPLPEVRSSNPLITGLAPLATIPAPELSEVPSLA